MKVFFYIESCYKGVKCIQVFQMLHIFQVKVGFFPWAVNRIGNCIGHTNFCR